MKKILLISGSLRKDSYNTKVLESIRNLFTGKYEFAFANVNLPLFNADLESDFPEEVIKFKDEINSADAVIIATPEYNRSISGVLKNAIDWASRPNGKNSFDSKPVLTLGVSNGRLSTAVAQSHLKQIMVYLNADLVGQPELYLGNAKEIYNTETNEYAPETMKLVATGFEKLVSKIK